MLYLIYIYYEFSFCYLVLLCNIVVLSSVILVVFCIRLIFKFLKRRGSETTNCQCDCHPGTLERHQELLLIKAEH